MQTEAYQNEWPEPYSQDERELLRQYMDMLGITLADLENYKQVVLTVTETEAA